MEILPFLQDVGTSLLILIAALPILLGVLILRS